MEWSRTSGFVPHFFPGHDNNGCINNSDVYILWTVDGAVHRTFLHFIVLQSLGLIRFIGHEYAQNISL